MESSQFRNYITLTSNPVKATIRFISEDEFLKYYHNEFGNYID